MKFIKTIAATACALAVTAAAHAATYVDKAEYYELNHSLATGDNSAQGREGFGAWEIEKHGTDYADCAIWDPSALGFQDPWAGKTQAFAIIGKGSGVANAIRPFRKALEKDESFSLEMGILWDGNNGNLDDNPLKGFVLTAGSTDVIVVDHRIVDGSGKIAINGNSGNDILNLYADPPYPMTWTFTAKDATTLTITATPRDGSKTIYEEDWNVGTSAIDGFRLQSAHQANENEDKRQTYFDNFTLELNEELPPPPEIVTLTITPVGDAWKVTSAEEDCSFELSRSSADGVLDVSITSTDDNFIHPTSLSFADGETSKEFSVHATLTGSGNSATITASATDCDSNAYDIRGPSYSVGAEQYETYAGESFDFWVDASDAYVRDESKVTLVSEPDGAITLPDSLTWNENEDGTAYVRNSLTVNASGSLALYYDGVPFGDYGITVLSAKIQFADGSRTALKTDTPCEYTVYGTLIDGAVTVAITGEATGTATPAEFELFDEATFSVTFTTAGSATITVSDGNGHEDSIGVTVSAPVDPSDFDGYIAYDDASLYEDGFDYDSTGAGSEGFSEWSVVEEAAEYHGIIIAGNAGDYSEILTAGSAFGLYANGNTPQFSVVRPFAEEGDSLLPSNLEPGQKASIEFLSDTGWGTRYVRFVRIYDGTPYNRFEVQDKDGAISVKVEQQGETALTLWTNKPYRLVASIELAADGSSYDLALYGYKPGSEFPDEMWKGSVDSNVKYWGDGIQGIQIGADYTEHDFIFNKLAVEQVAEPVVNRAIGWGDGVYNPEGDGTYTITLTATTDDIGEVAIAVDPAEGALTLESATIDLTGVTSATITYMLSGSNPGDTFHISATPVDTDVAALDGEGAYNVTVIESYLSLWCDDGGEFTTDTTNIWLSLSASPSKYGTYNLVSSDPSVIELSVSSLKVPNDQGESTVWFDVFVKGAGDATLSIEGEDANWVFHVTQGSVDPSPYPNALLITECAVDGNNLQLKVEGVASRAFYATEIKEGDWDWKEMSEERLTISTSEDKSDVTVGMDDDNYMIIRVDR